MNDLVVVIMAGGAGTRFWPLSTESRPKQFLALTGARTLLQMSFDRISSMVTPEKVFVLTNGQYVSVVREQLPEIPGENVVGEPCRRDTAAAIALASLLVHHRFPGKTMLVLTADHVIEPMLHFQSAVLEAAQHCGNGSLYTLGISPTYPATQFGYLEMGEPIATQGALPHFQLRGFKEKPSLPLAQEFLEKKNFYWNSGMFVWKTSDILAEFAKHLPNHLTILEPVIGALDSTEFEKAFAQLQGISIDFAIMEKASSLRAVIPSIEWDDVGGWLAAAKYLPVDDHDNHFHGRLVSKDSQSNTVFLEDTEETLVLLGVSDLVIVRAGNKTLVAHKDNLDSLKEALLEIES